MRSYRRLIPGMLCALALTLSAEAWAAPMVLFDVNDLGGGLFQYDLTVDNTGGSEPLNGLLVLQGGSVFGLDPTSAIGAPQDVGGNPAADWSFIAPFPVDPLSYLSLDPTGDMPLNGSLGGFFFQSTQDPANLRNDDFAVVGIGATTARQIPLGNTQFVPELSTLLLLATGLSGLLGYEWRRRKQAS
jgi:hypothetical protein